MTMTIGSQTDVPDIGDPIVSPWYQDTAKKIMHVFATTAARDAWVSPPNGAICQAPAGTWWNRVAGAWVAFPTPYLMRTGTLTQATNGNGDALITFNPAFPVSLVSAVVSDASQSADLGFIPKVMWASSNKTTLVVRVYLHDGSKVVNNGVTAFSYVAYGT